MGLDTSHDCWHGAYSAFHRWRCAVAQVAGIDLGKMEGFVEHGDYIQWSTLPPDPLHKLLHHSDCDGEIAVEDCIPLAERLEALVPALEAYDVSHTPAGHLDRPGARGMAGAARRFAAGLREAAAAGESVDFH